MKRLLWLMTGCTLFSTMAIELIAPFYALFVTTLRSDGIILAGTTWGIYYLGAAILLLFTGKLDDKYDSSNFLILGFGLRVIGTAGYLFVAEPIHLLYVQLIHGCAKAFIGPSYRKIYGENIDHGQEGAEWSYPLSISFLGKAIAVFSGGVIVATHGFKILFIIMLAAHIISFGFSIATKLRFNMLRKKGLVN